MFAVVLLHLQAGILGKAVGSAIAPRYLLCRSHAALWLAWAILAIASRPCDLWAIPGRSAIGLFSGVVSLFASSEVFVRCWTTLILLIHELTLIWYKVIKLLMIVAKLMLPVALFLNLLFWLKMMMLWNLRLLIITCLHDRVLLFLRLLIKLWTCIPHFRIFLTLVSCLHLFAVYKQYLSEPTWLISATQKFGAFFSEKSFPVLIKSLSLCPSLMRLVNYQMQLYNIDYKRMARSRRSLEAIIQFVFTWKLEYDMSVWLLTNLFLPLLDFLGDALCAPGNTVSCIHVENVINMAIKPKNARLNFVLIVNKLATKHMTVWKTFSAFSQELWVCLELSSFLESTYWRMSLRCHWNEILACEIFA